MVIESPYIVQSNYSRFPFFKIPTLLPSLTVNWASIFLLTSESATHMTWIPWATLNSAKISLIILPFSFDLIANKDVPLPSAQATR